jgi:FlaA1/EpsC-like NDP-sugar epimerase
MNFSKLQIEKILNRKEFLFLKSSKSVFNKKTFIILGAAGSIASSFIYKFQNINYEQLILIDKNENDLVKLTRKIELKNRTKCLFLCVDINNLPLSFYDRIKNKKIFLLNFAALKHVRSEIYEESFINMFLTNIVSPLKIFYNLQKKTKLELFFSISSDKSANPRNYMGVSKRLSEYSLSYLKKKYPNVKIISTRFPNVLFSKGSISESILENTINKEIFGIPKYIKRYFISKDEAASIIFATLTREFDGYISFPTNALYKSPIDIVSLTKRIVKNLNYNPIFFTNILKAIEYKNLSRKKEAYIVLTEHTQGEKDIEEFVSNKDIIYNTNFDALKKIKLPSDKRLNNDFKKILENKSKFDKTTFLKLVKKIKEFKHQNYKKNLYQVK